jgi:hypothetical protein
VSAARFGVPGFAALRTSMLAEGAPAVPLARAAAPWPALPLRTTVRLAVGLAEELADGSVAVRGQPMHAVARFDPFEIGG